MASGYPASLDTFATTSPASLGDDDAQGRTHAERHNDIGDAMNKVQAELGVDPAGYAATVVTRLNGMDRMLLPADGTFFSSARSQTSYSSAYGLNYVHYQPIIIPMAMSVDGIQIYVATAETSATPRLGLYSNDPATDKPKDLIVDAGTVDASGAAGTRTATFADTALTPGLYWMACCPQGASTALRMYQVSNGIRVPSDSAAQSAASGYREPDISGSLPASTGALQIWLYTPSMALRRGA